MESSPPNRAVTSEMHSALFAVGACFGVLRAVAQARRLREQPDPMIADLLRQSSEVRAAGDDDAHVLDRVARAAGYLITVTAEADPAGSLKDDPGILQPP
jgi:hypothetical protein